MGDNMAFFIEYILPVLVGGFIGWFTNYLAIKMLFRPYKKIRVFGVGMPFTPGLIPKEKNRIAESLSNTISKEFLNKEVLTKYLTSIEMEQKINVLIENVYQDLKNNDDSFYTIILKHVDKENFESNINKAKKKITKEIINKFIEHNMSQKIASKVIKNITVDNDTVIGKTLSFILNDKLSLSIETIIKEKIDEYIKEKGEKEIEILIDKEVEKLLSNSTSKLCETYGIKIESIKKHLVKVYEVFINSCVEKILVVVDFKKIINNRIQELDVKELELIILNIAKKELNAITYIGGVLGILIGMINIFI